MSVSISPHLSMEICRNKLHRDAGKHTEIHDWTQTPGDQKLWLSGQREFDSNSTAVVELTKGKESHIVGEKQRQEQKNPLDLEELRHSDSSKEKNK